MIFLGDFSFVRIFLKNLYRVTMTTSSVVGIPTGDTFIPRDISVGILKPRGCSYHCDTGRSVTPVRDHINSCQRHLVNYLITSPEVRRFLYSKFKRNFTTLERENISRYMGHHSNTVFTIKEQI